ncbi:nuclear transport factor 2 family protein [Pedobacter sp.]|uniref:nuclear transport factor 2 family protein n=1 Tax=Pedobacter sp. TaxID=1411316 RepID=UPI003D7FAC3A
MSNKEILEKANVAIRKGNYEDFLTFCTDDTIWEFVADQTLHGKEEVRQYMAKTYVEPPKLTEERFIAEGEYLVVIGKITLKNIEGKVVKYSYCDVWRFRDGKMAALQAFVVE